MNGPMNGATTANGAKLTSRYSSTLLRAASGLIAEEQRAGERHDHRHIARRHQRVGARQAPERRTTGTGGGRTRPRGGRTVTRWRWRTTAAAVRVSAERSAYTRSVELVAETADRDDAGRVGRVRLDLGPQPLDVHVERLGVADVVAAPHPVDQRLARQHPAGVGQQEVQQLELLERQRDVGRRSSVTACSSGSSDDVADARAPARRSERAGRVAGRRRSTARMRATSSRIRYGLVT